jgi:uncharacterized protein
MSRSMETAGTVAGIWRYPLKSAPGERLGNATVTTRGIPGDRAWALIDAASGRIGSAKLPRTWGRLLEVSARFTREPSVELPAPPIEIVLPGGQVAASSDPAADAALSEFIGRPVRLTAEVPAERIVERVWPDIDGLPMRDVETAGEIGQAAPGAFFDHAPVHILTTAALAALRDADPAVDADPRRFRPTILVESGDGSPGFVENGWVGRRVSIGEAVLRIVAPSPRCVVVTLPHGDLPRDLGVLTALVAANRIPFEPGGVPMPSIGAYAIVEKPGMIREGDRVEIE